MIRSISIEGGWTLESYTNEMQRCYARQPQAVRQILKAMPLTLQPIEQICREQRFRCIILLGIGSSYHALRMACAYARTILEIPVFVQTPEQLGWIDTQSGSGIVAIAASQSGTSINMLKGIRGLKARKVPVVLITQHEDSPMGKEADCVLLLRMQEEKAGPKTMGVLATAITAAFALCKLNRQTGLWMEELMVSCAAFADRLEENLQAAKQYALRHADEFKSHSAWIVTGAAAGEAALKLTETLREPAVAYELEELVHGPCACLSRRTILMCLSTAWDERDRIDTLCGLCEETGSTACDIVVTQGGTIEQGNRLLLSCPRHVLFSSLMLLLPAQAISAWVSPEKGIDLDLRIFPAWTAALGSHLPDDAL